MTTSATLFNVGWAEQVWESAPQTAFARNNVAVGRWRSGQPQAAAQLFEELREAGAVRPCDLFLLAQCYAAMSERSRAQAVLKEANEAAARFRTASLLDRQRLERLLLETVHSVDSIP